MLEHYNMRLYISSTHSASNAPVEDRCGGVDNEEQCLVNTAECSHNELRGDHGAIIVEPEYAQNTVTADAEDSRLVARRSVVSTLAGARGTRARLHKAVAAREIATDTTEKSL